MPAQKESTTIIGRNIRNRRNELNMTQAELSELAGITPGDAIIYRTWNKQTPAR